MGLWKTFENGQERQDIEAFSGAGIPGEYQTVLEKLAEFYDKYAPNQ